MRQRERLARRRRIQRVVLRWANRGIKIVMIVGDRVQLGANHPIQFVDLNAEARTTIRFRCENSMASTIAET